MCAGPMNSTLGALMQMPHIHVARVALAGKHRLGDGCILRSVEVVSVHVATQEETSSVQIMDSGPITHRIGKIKNA